MMKLSDSLSGRGFSGHYASTDRALACTRMSTTISPLAGKPAPTSLLVDLEKLLAASTDQRPDPTVRAQRVMFGTSGHRGSPFKRSFNEWHILAVSQAICDYRKRQGIVGPLFLGIDTHALSAPASVSALEVLAANGVDVMIAEARRIHAHSCDFSRNTRLQP